MNNVQSFYLKKMAALQFSGSVDNVSTRYPLHMVQDRDDTVIWHSLDDIGQIDDPDNVMYTDVNDPSEEYPSLMAFVASQLGIREEPDSEAWKNAVKEFNATKCIGSHTANEPLLVPYEDTYMEIPVGSGKEEDKLTADDEKSYLQIYQDAYSLDFDVDEVYALEHIKNYRDVGPFFILDDAKKYMKYQGHNLKQPRTYTYGEAYGDEGEFATLYSFLMETGKQLLDEESKKVIEPGTHVNIFGKEGTIGFDVTSRTYGSLFGLPESADATEPDCTLNFTLLTSVKKIPSPFGAHHPDYTVTDKVHAAVSVTGKNGKVMFNVSTSNFDATAADLQRAIGYREVEEAVNSEDKTKLTELVLRLVNYVRYKRLGTPEQSSEHL